MFNEIPLIKRQNANNQKKRKISAQEKRKARADKWWNVGEVESKKEGESLCRKIKPSLEHVPNQATVKVRWFVARAVVITMIAMAVTMVMMMTMMMMTMDLMCHHHHHLSWLEQYAVAVVVAAVAAWVEIVIFVMDDDDWMKMTTKVHTSNQHNREQWLETTTKQTTLQTHTPIPIWCLRQ